MRWQSALRRGAELLDLMAREFGRIPHYNAEGERLMRAMRNHGRDRQGAGRVWILRRVQDWAGKGKAVALSLGVLLAVTQAAGQAEAAVLSEAVHALAENILGSGAVISVRTTENEAQALVRWESATYRPANALPTTRNLIYGEAELATGSIMGRLPQIVRIRFTIVRRNRMLATGENWRGRGVTLVFSSELGGGIMHPGDPVYDPSRKGGGNSGTEM